MLLLRLKNNFFPPIKIVNEQSIKSEGIHSNLEKLLGKIFLECRMGNPHSSFLEQLHKVAVGSRDAAVIRIDDESIVADILFEKDDPLGPHCRGAPPKELNSILVRQIHYCPLDPQTIITALFWLKGFQTSLVKVHGSVSGRNICWL